MRVLDDPPITGQQRRAEGLRVGDEDAIGRIAVWFAKEAGTLHQHVARYGE